MQILVSFDSFMSYQEKFGTPYLDKKNRYRIWPPSKQEVLNEFYKTNEMFDGIEKRYDIQKSIYMPNFKVKLGYKKHEHLNEN